MFSMTKTDLLTGAVEKSELLKKSKTLEKVGDLKEIDKPLAKYIDASNDRADLKNKHEDITFSKDHDSESFSGCPVEGHGGKWESERGNSIWYPDKKDIPKNPVTNPEGLKWEKILDKYSIEGIPFKNGEPDFSVVSKGTVEIDNFSENRYGKGGNFDQACEKLAEKRGCTKQDVKNWMRENKYTWHEKSDCKTMEKVPTEIHGNIRHEGGISAIKNEHGSKENSL